MAHSKQYFTFLEKIKSSYVRLRNGNSLEIHGKGTVQFELLNQN